MYIIMSHQAIIKVIFFFKIDTNVIKVNIKRMKALMFFLYRFNVDVVKK